MLSQVGSNNTTNIRMKMFHDFLARRLFKTLIEKCRARMMGGLLFPLIIVFLCSSSVSMRAGYTATVNPNSNVVTNFQGWGTSLCWWANIVGNYPNRTNFVNMAFNTLKLNIVRYNIGGGQNPSVSEPSQSARTIMQGFEPTNGIWNWSADANQRWVLQQAEANGANLVDAFANSPPWWMCGNSNVDGGNTPTNNLQVNNETNFAIYLATVVSNLTVLDGDHFNYLTPMNEPNGSKWSITNSSLQEGCDMSPAQQGTVVGILSTQLSTIAPSVGIDAAEDVDPYQSYNDLTSYSSAQLADVALLTTHTYSLTGSSDMTSEASSQKKPLWVSEYGDSDTSGMTMSRYIYNDIDVMEARAWVNWQVVDPSWGLIISTLLPTTNPSYVTNYTITEKFYVMGQFSEFVRPGCNIISVNDTNTLAAWNPTNSTLVLVLINNNGISTNVTYNLSDFGSVPWQVAATQTSASESMVPLPALLVSNETFSSTVPADSVTTFVLTTNLLYTNPLIYSNSFNGGTTTINGTPPTVANIGTNVALWAFTYTNAQDGGWLANGAIGTNAGSALLPFTPQAGAIYCLTASLAMANIGNWIGLGFSQSAIQGNSPTGERFSDSNVKGNPWMDMQVTAAPDLFGGPKGTLTVAGGNLLPTNGTYNVQVFLNTLGTQWTTTAYVNGTEVGTTNYTTNPTIGYVGFTQQGFPGGTSGVQWNYVTLSTGLLPIFTQQPTSGVMPAGAAFTNTVAALDNASGGPLFYQWYTNNVPISGATNTTLIFNPVSTGNASTDYYVVVTNNYGAVTSSAASLTVINTNSPNMGFSVTNNQLTLSWPPDYFGWTLQTQTNSLSVGLSTNWVMVSGSASVTNIVIPINLTNGTVFYRLLYTP